MGSRAYKGKSYQESSVTSSLVNNLLNNVLPGINNNAELELIGKGDPNDLLAQRRNNKFSNLKKKKHAVQIINDSIKKRAFLDDINEVKIIKKQKEKLRKSIKQNTHDTKKLILDANIENLKRHYKEGNLSPQEQKLLNKTIKKEVMKLKQWDLDYDVKEDLKELQHDILLVTDAKYAESLKRKSLKSKKKSKSSAFKPVSSSKTDHKVPGLTPGLAPVDMEDSDSEEDVRDSEELPFEFD